jgi:hypothetical protein
MRASPALLTRQAPGPAHHTHRTHAKPGELKRAVPKPAHRLVLHASPANGAASTAPPSPVVRLFRPGSARESTTSAAPSRPALVFLPGTDGTSHGLDTQVKGLHEAGWEVYAASYEAEDTTWRWPAAVAAVSAAIAALRSDGRRPVLLVGESFGACLALRVAAQVASPDGGGPSALALINPATAFRRSLGGAPALLARSGLLGVVPDAAYGLAQRILLPLLVDRGRTGPGGEAAAGLMMAMAGGPGGGGGPTPSRPAAAASHRLSLMVDEGGLGEGDLRRIRVPTLLIASGGDALLPSLSEAARLEGLIPGAASPSSSRPRRARLVLPESGHAPLLEAGVDLAGLLRAGGLGPADLGGSGGAVAAPPPAPLPPAAANQLPPWARPDPAVDAACEALTPLRALIAPCVTGATNLPCPTDPAAARRPLLFVANHARYGLYDLPFLVSELYARGVRARGVAHPTHWRGPLGAQFERFGAIRSSPRAVLGALTAGEACLLFPGGGREVTKGRGAEYTLFWRDAPDLVRLAARANALIIPLSSVGADDAYTLLADAGDVLANPVAGPAVRALLKAVLPGSRLALEEAVFPVSALPVPAFLPSIIPAPIPIPRPARLYFEIGAPVDAAAEVEAAGGGVEGAAVVYGRVKAAVEAGITSQLAVRAADADGLRSFEARAGRVRKRWLG